MVVRPRSIFFLIPLAFFFGQTPVHFLFGSFQADGVGRGLFSLWLCGAISYFVARSFAIGIFAAAVLGVCGAIGFVAFAHTGAEYDMNLYPFFLSHFLKS